MTLRNQHISLTPGFTTITMNALQCTFYSSSISQIRYGISIATVFTVFIWTRVLIRVYHAKVFWGQSNISPHSIISTFNHLICCYLTGSFQKFQSETDSEVMMSIAIYISSKVYLTQIKSLPLFTNWLYLMVISTSMVYHNISIE